MSETLTLGEIVSRVMITGFCLGAFILVITMWPRRVMMTPKEREALEMMALIEMLREREGWLVQLVCDNPNLDGPGYVLEVFGEWCTSFQCDWCWRTFIGDSLLLCLRDARANLVASDRAWHQGFNDTVPATHV